MYVVGSFWFFFDAQLIPGHVDLFRKIKWQQVGGSAATVNCDDFHFRRARN